MRAVGLIKTVPPWDARRKRPPGRPVLYVPAERFGVDGVKNSFIETISELSAGASGMNGANWGAIEPDAPDPDHTYASSVTLEASIAILRANGLKLQFNYHPEVPGETDHWALDYSGGLALRIKPEHLEDWQDSVVHVVEVTDADYLQISSEADNNWVDSQAGAEGFAQAVSLAATAAKAVKPDIKIMAAGFNFGNRFGLGSASPEVGLQIWVGWFLAKMKEYETAGGGTHDILSLHLSHRPEYFSLTVSWVMSKMEALGIVRPIWGEDMSSGPFYSDDGLSTPDEVQFQEDVEANDPTAVALYEVEQAKFCIKKSVSAFAGGVARCFMSAGLIYNIVPAIWNYQCFLRASGLRKAAFYSYQQLITAIDGFVRAEQLNVVDASVYKFTFAGGKPTVVVAWADAPIMVNLSSVMQTPTIVVRTVVTALDGSNLPIYPTDIPAASNSVPANVIPALVVS